jgi:maltooligosyltrehalose trehalohydrolase
VRIADGTYPMSGPTQRGWWDVSVESAVAGTDYGFVIDDDPKIYPDPRSQWQPNGVHGMSRVYDQAVFQWTDAGWEAPPLARAVVY